MQVSKNDIASEVQIDQAKRNKDQKLRYVRVWSLSKRDFKNKTAFFGQGIRKNYGAIYVHVKEKKTIRVAYNRLKITFFDKKLTLQSFCTKCAGAN